MPSNLGQETLPNLGIGMLIIALSRASHGPHVQDIILRIIASMFIVPRGTGPSGGGGNFGVEHLVEAMFLWELDLGACCVCIHESFAAGVFPGMERGYVGATGS
ncbi:hypothetical protein TIFTF001_018750 [Ficus carica]|uniref:Uncharacterized protein n=1 Tax=Ficus carica TaxID=3494 RepID=A0AA88A7M6_FICCA|nr:hypothetical protein TIFTF001_018750 [Ficus carica]